MSRAKKLGDYAWCKIHWADLLVETAAMSGDEVKAWLHASYVAWRASDYDALPPFFRRCADDILHDGRRRSEGKIHTPDVPHMPTYEDICGHKATSLSLSLSDIGDIYKAGKEERREESVERREERAGWMLHLSRLIAAGPPTWMHYEMPAVEPWRYLGETRPDIEPEEIIQAAAEYRQYVARIGTAPRYIKRPASWISSGGWMVDYATLGDQESAPIETPAEKKKREREERNAALMADIRRMEEEMNHGRM